MDEEELREVEKLNAELKNTRKRYQQELSEIATRVECLAQSSRGDKHAQLERKVRELLPGISGDFFCSQLRNARNPTTPEFTRNDVVFALALFAQSETCYFYLKSFFALPEVEELVNFVEKSEIDLGEEGASEGRLSEEFFSKRGLNFLLKKKVDPLLTSGDDVARDEEPTVEESRNEKSS